MSLRLIERYVFIRSGLFGYGSRAGITSLQPLSYVRSDFQATMSKTKRHIKLALLLCDTPIQTVRETHGTYLEIFQRLLQSSLPQDTNTDVEFTLEGFDVVGAQVYPDLGESQDSDDGYAGVLISGSGK